LNKRVSVSILPSAERAHFSDMVNSLSPNRPLVSIRRVSPSQVRTLLVGLPPRP
jgi:hypothetical protein